MRIFGVKMNFYDWLSAIFVAFGFVAWAVWGKFYNLHPALLGVMNISIMALTVTFLSFNQFGDIGQKTLPSLKSFAIMIFLCVVNGIAFYVYSAKVTNSLIKTGNYIVILSILMLIEARFLDWYLNHNSMSVVNVAGLVTIILGILLFTR